LFLTGRYRWLKDVKKRKRRLKKEEEEEDK